MSKGNEDREFIFNNSELMIRISDCMSNDKPIVFSVEDFLNISEEELIDMKRFLKSNWEEIMEDIDFSFNEYYFWEIITGNNYNDWTDILERYDENIITKIFNKSDVNSDKYKICNNLLNKRDPYYDFEIVSEEKKVKERIGYVYLLYIEKLNVYKIGKTTNMNSRMDTFGVKFPADFVILHFYKSDNYDEEEVRLHRMFKHKLVMERSEWFNLDKLDLNYICSLGGK